jgi:DNA-binding response OmpR family regulator
MSERTINILLVDDHKDTCLAIGFLLGRHGYHVQTAYSLKSALSIADGEHFDLLISDIVLPDGTGNELLHQLRQKMEIEAIAMSGWSTPEDVTRSRDAGFHDLLAKPLTYERLDTLIRSIFPENG